MLGLVQAAMEFSRPGEDPHRLKCSLHIFLGFSLCFEAFKCVSWGPACALLTVPLLSDAAYTWEGDAGSSTMQAQ